MRDHSLVLKGESGRQRSVYLIHQRHTEWFKIGSAKLPGKRAVELQIGSPLPLDLVAVLWFDDHETANLWEIILRNELVDLGCCEQMSGEWVRFEGDDEHTPRERAEADFHFGFVMLEAAAEPHGIDGLRFAAGKRVPA